MSLRAIKSEDSNNDNDIAESIVIGSTSAGRRVSTKQSPRAKM